MQGEKWARENLKAIQEIGMYDDNYFMYFEDWDLSRRMHKKYKTIYYPLVSVYHGYESGANKSFKLFKIFIHSAITYFNKSISVGTSTTGKSEYYLGLSYLSTGKKIEACNALQLANNKKYPDAATAVINNCQ